MDSKTLRLLEYLNGAPCRSYDDLERFHGSSLELSPEYMRLFSDGLAFISTDIFQPEDCINRISITPLGRELLERHRRERRRDFLAYGTFVIVLLTFLLKLFGYF